MFSRLLMQRTGPFCMIMSASIPLWINTSAVSAVKEVLGGQRVIHAYGQNAGGYVYSFGLARAVINPVDEFLFEIPQVAKL